jgi:hypothetical protein
MTRTQFDSSIGSSTLDETTFDETTFDDSTIGRADQGTMDGGSSLNEAGREASESVGHIAGRAADLGLQRADQGKVQAAQTISRLAGSMRQISTDLEGEQPAIAGAARTAAEQAERLATYMERTDARQIIGNVEDAARRQPLLFLGGAFALGLVAARVLKAGTDTNQDRMTSDFRNGTGDFDGRSARRS